MKLIPTETIVRLSQRWFEVSAPNHPQNRSFYDKMVAHDVLVYMPVGELSNKAIGGFVWAWKMKGIIEPEPITDKHRFQANGLEGCFCIPEPLTTAILIFLDVQPNRINIFCKSDKQLKAIEGII